METIIENNSISDRAYIYNLRYDLSLTANQLVYWLQNNYPQIDILSDNMEKKRYLYVNPNGLDLEKIVAKFIIEMTQDRLNSNIEDNIKESIKMNLDVFIDIEAKDDDCYIIEFVK